MAKYVATLEIDAEQFLPDEDKIPKGVTSDGPRSPKVDPRSSWIVYTREGAKYLKSGDYVVKNADGSLSHMEKAVFEGLYKLADKGKK